MLKSTPIARTEAAALTRFLYGVSRGYSRYTMGTIDANRTEYLANKFQSLHFIAATASQRYSRKKKGLANSMLVLYSPEKAKQTHWLLLFTEGELNSHEKLLSVEQKLRPQWLGYELYRYTNEGKLRWSLKRPKVVMQELVELLYWHLNKRDHASVQGLLQQAANQPGFHGVKGQTWELTQIAQKNGYPRELPFLYYLQKISHGERLVLL